MLRQLDVRDAFAVFYRRRWLGLAIVLATLLGVSVGNYLTYPSYESSVRILLESPPGLEIPFTREQIAFKKAEITQTQCELAQSNPVLEETVRRLELDQRPIPSGTLRDAVHAWWRGLLDSIDRAKESAKEYVIVRLFGGKYTPPPTADPFRSAVDDLRRALLAEPVPNTDIIAITVRDRDAQLAARIAGTIGDIYVVADVDAQRKRARQIYELIQGQVEAARPAYEAARRAVEEFEDQREGRLLADRIRAKVQEVSDLELAYSELVESRKSKIDSLQMDLARLEQIYDPDHPKVLAARSELEEARRHVERTTTQSIDQAGMAYAGTLLARIAEAKAQLADLNRLDGEYARLRHEREQEEKLYYSLKEKREAALIAEATRAAGTRVVDPAVAAAEPSRPRKWLNLGLGLAIGMIVAAAFCGLVEFLDRSVRTPADVTAAAGDVGVLASIPQRRRWLTPAGRRRGLIADVARQDAYTRGHAAVFEQTALRTDAQRPRLLLVTSAVRGEGRTCTAANLAAFASRLGGGRVLLVDADLERPALSAWHGAAGGRGLTEVLRAGAAWDELAQPAGREGVRLLPAGSGGAPGLIASAGSKLDELVNGWRRSFDWVIVDAPPVLSSAAAPLLVRCGLDALLVIRAGVTRVEVVREAASRMSGPGGRVLGAVLNRRSFVIPRYAYRRI